MWPEIVKLTLVIILIVALLGWLVVHGASDLFPNAKRQWKVLFIVSWFVGMTGLLAMAALVEGHSHSVKLDPQSARIYSYNLHGITIYLTKEEDLAIHFFEYISLMAVLTGFGSGFIMQRQQQAAENPNNMRQDS
jgi:hypothetical protein